MPDQNPLYDAWFAAAKELGLPHNPDYNGASQEGIVKTQATISNGRRMSTAHCYLKPARKRPNLRIEARAMVQKILVNGTQCTGVSYRQNGKLIDATANCEVILSAGGVAIISGPMTVGVGAMTAESIRKKVRGAKVLKASLVIEEAYKGNGVNLIDFHDDVEDEAGKEVDFEELKEKIIEADQQKVFCPDSDKVYGVNQIKKTMAETL